MLVMVLSQKYDEPSQDPSESIHGCNLSQSCHFFGSPLKSSMISRSPTPVETYSKVMHLGNVFWCSVFYWMSFHKSMLGSHSHNPYIRCVFFLSWRSGGYESPWFCWFPKNVLRKGIGKMKMPPKCQGAIGDLIKGHQDRQVVDGWPVAKNHFH